MLYCIVLYFRLFPPGSGACPARSLPSAQVGVVQRVRGDGQGPRPARSGRTGHDHAPVPLSAAIAHQENKHPASVVRPTVMKPSHAIRVMRIANKTAVRGFAKSNKFQNKLGWSSLHPPTPPSKLFFLETHH